MDERTRLAKNNYKERLRSLPGVVGVGIGAKRKAGVITGQEAVVIYVRKKLPLSELAPTAVVPQTLEGGVPTDVIEVGDVRALPLAPTLVEDHKTTHRPLVGGVSVSPANVGLSGTIGLPLVYRGAIPCLLSNRHVIAPSEYAAVYQGMPVTQPSNPDGPGPIVATLLDWVPTNSNGLNEVDAAVAALAEAATSDILGIGDYSQLGEPSLGQRVVKSGRTSGVTQGTITGLDATIQINYPRTGLATFEGQIILDPMLQPGDSGSAILDYATRAVVGLGFAASDQIAVANRMSVVFAKLGLALRTKGVPVAEGLASIQGSLVRAWGFDNVAKKWSLYEPGAPLPSLEYLEPGKGYWVQLSGAASLTYGPNTWALSPGWNLIGWI